MVGFLDIPYELRMQIYESTPAADIICLLQTSRETYSDVADESMWKMLCARYGITSLELFQPGATFRQVYTGLLHTYGPFIGLWANDDPYHGAVIQFRYRRGGIVGEKWTFSSSFSFEWYGVAPSSSQLQPCPVAFVFIELIDPTQSLALTDHDIPESLHVCDTMERVRIHWHVPAASDSPQSYTGPPPSICVLAPTYQAYCTPFFDGYSWEPEPHPEFPPSTNDSCYDKDRDRPPLREESWPTFDNTLTCTSQDIEGNGQILAGTTSKLLKPWAISFVYSYPDKRIQDCFVDFHSRFACLGLDGRQYEDSPLDPIDYFRRICPRYYPLRYPKPPVDPTRSQLDVFNGLWIWKIEYSTQVLFLDYVQESKTIRALRITGDDDDPRGTIAWTFDVQSETLLDEQDLRLFGDISPEWKIYAGTTTSRRLHRGPS
ncbi:hypothetical protein QCA50_003668 [Cerrena zonata]|uniref:F-box domain-containing protein n=1 Tax=Cerrena zonata TaxID=2478898 RepID=A0AAW0GVH4_9APHY